MIKTEKCARCFAYVRMDDDGWLFPHLERGSDTEICTCRTPKKSGIEEYTVGFDSDPWVMNGGLPTLGKKR